MNKINVALMILNSCMCIIAIIRAHLNKNTEERSAWAMAFLYTILWLIK